jgi:biotin transport system substrate-specific component
MNEAPLASLHRLVWAALMAALTAVGAYVSLPLGPVPISLQTLFVMMSGFILGPAYGAAAMGLYLGAGMVGLPVFAGGKSGFAALMGPTGGYLIGFIACAFITGLAGGNAKWPRLVLFSLFGTAALYALGILRLKFFLDASWGKTLAVGMIPFLPGNALKLVLAVAAQRFLQRKKLLPGI